MSTKRISRREMLKGLGLTAVSTALAACAPKVVKETVVVEKPVEKVVEKVVTAVPESVTLNVMHNWVEANPQWAPMEAFLDEFAKAYPNIEIKQEVIPNVEDLPIKVETAFLAGEEPDIIFQNFMSNSTVWTKNGLTIPVDGLMDAWGLKDRFVPKALQDWTTTEGKLAGFPLEGFVWPIWYNMKILDKASVRIPKTIDELITAAGKIREAGYQPFTTAGSDTHGAIFFGMSIVVKVGPERAYQLFHYGGLTKDPDAVAGVELYVKLRDAGLFSDNSPGLDIGGFRDEYYREVAAMANIGSWAFAECPNDVAEHTELDGFPLPEGSPLKYPLIFGAFIAKGIFITRNGAKKIDACEKFVKTFYQPEVIGRFVNLAAMIAPLKGIPVDPNKVPPLLLKGIALADKDLTTMTPIGAFLQGSVRPTFFQSVGPLANSPGSTVEQILQAIDDAYAPLTE